MATYKTDICTSADNAPTVTNLVAHCQVCGTHWQVRSENRDDTKGCSLCDAPESAIVIASERPAYGGTVVYE